MSTLPEHHETVPLNQLVVSPDNVRKRNRKAEIEALAASIAAHGLLQNLSVTLCEDGKYFVVAGGRRLAALKLLAKSGAIAKDHPVACKVVACEAAREASLAENVHRTAMDPLDEAEAFADLQAGGAMVEDIARRFGATRRHVEQRLGLAGLSAKLKAAWKRGDLNLDAAKAFCLVEDHARQDAVFRSMPKPVTHAGSVRSRLMEGSMRASDRLARFTGLEAYEAAGGALRRDLFDEEAVFIEDPSLVAHLAQQKLDGAAHDWREKGWGWVETSCDGAQIEGLAPLRIQPVWRDPTGDEQKQLDDLEARIDALDAALETSSIDDDPRWSERDDLEAAYETIRQAARTWDVHLIRHAGVVLGVAHDGTLSASEGHVRKVDQKTIDAIRRGSKDADGEDSVSEEGEITGASPAITKALARDLTQARTRAIQAGVAASPDIALAICVSALSARVLHSTSLPGVGVTAGVTGRGPGEGLGERVDALDADPPSDPRACLVWCLAQDRSRLLEHLACRVARTLDLVHEDASARDKALQAVSDDLAQALDLDMRTAWSPSLDYWVRLPKTSLADELKHASEARGLSGKDADARRKDALKMKKDVLARKVDDAWRGQGYLPELLITPFTAGSVTVVETPAIAAE